MPPKVGDALDKIPDYVYNYTYEEAQKHFAET